MRLTGCKHIIILPLAVRQMQIQLESVSGGHLRWRGMKIVCFGDSNTYGYDPRSRLGGRHDADSR